MEAFTIKDLENLSGIKAHTIRIWEKRYSFLRPHRSETNIRYYSNKELKLFLNVSLLNRYGYKISSISKMDEKEISDRIVSLSQTEARQELLVNQLLQHMIDLDTGTFERDLQDCTKSYGIEECTRQIIFPFLERIGILWLTSHINSAQEHLVTSIIRHKLIAGIENLKSGKSGSGKTVLLFLPEGEYHEIGLLFIYYLLKKRGIGVLYIGADVPVKDVAYIAAHKNPLIIYSHLTCATQNFSLEKFLANIHALLGNYTIIISGKLTQSYKEEVPPNVCLKRSLSEVTDYINTL
jgi:methanogenic corrinoid protein MtbC1